MPVRANLAHGDPVAPRIVPAGAVRPPRWGAGRGKAFMNLSGQVRSAGGAWLAPPATTDRAVGPLSPRDQFGSWVMKVPQFALTVRGVSGMNSLPIQMAPSAATAAE